MFDFSIMIKLCITAIIFIIMRPYIHNLYYKAIAIKLKYKELQQNKERWNKFHSLMLESRNLNLSYFDKIEVIKKNIISPEQEMYLIGEVFFFRLESTFKETWFKSNQHYLLVFNNLSYYTQIEIEALKIWDKGQCDNLHSILPSKDESIIEDLKKSLM